MSEESWIFQAINFQGTCQMLVFQGLSSSILASITSVLSFVCWMAGIGSKMGMNPMMRKETVNSHFEQIQTLHSQFKTW